MRFHMGPRALRALVALLVLGFAGTVIAIDPIGADAVSTPAPPPPGGSGPLPGMSAVSAALPTTLPIALPARVHTRLRIRRVQLNVLDGRAASVTGALRPGRVGETVTLQAPGRRGWRTLSHTLTRAAGRFVLRYAARQVGSERVRVRFAGDGSDVGSRRLLGELNVYRLAGASWYGGGGGLACGGSLTSSTMGVANKTLPCGTLVTLRYNGRSVRVPVVDRGPYVAGREFDLTEATKRALGFEGVGSVWSTR
jgi:rare lipoprotein A